MGGFCLHGGGLGWHRRDAFDFRSFLLAALAHCDEFRYVDPVDGSVSDKQGLRFVMEDGSRVVFRLSGTGSVGATVRVYIEKYEADPSKQGAATADALRELVSIALELGDIKRILGRDEPTVIT